MLYDCVLEGGGVKLTAHVGVLAAIESRGMEPSHMAGGSAGAIVAVGRIAGYSPAELFTILKETDLTKFKDASWYKRPYNLVKHFGLYKGDYFHGFISELLQAKGIYCFGDLRSYNEEDKEDPRWMWKVRILAADVTKSMLVSLPQDLNHVYGLDPDEYSVADAVRASMAIPFFYFPSRIQSSYMVDGGLISNFPINIFDQSGEPSWPTFGILLDEQKMFNQINWKMYSFIIAVIRTMLSANDRMRINPEEYYHRTIRVPVGNIGATDFDITLEQKEWLYSSGYTAASEFLNNWSWSKYRDWATTIRENGFNSRDIDTIITDTARDIVSTGVELRGEALFNLIRLKLGDVIRRNSS